MLDFHSHLIPGVDDGAADIEEARAGMATMRDQGVGTIITTPHISASLVHRADDYERYQEAVERSWMQLRALAQEEFPSLRLERGMEVRLDTPYANLMDARLHLAGSIFVLVEFPFMSVPPNSTATLLRLRSDNLIPIVAHPERYSNIGGNEGLIEEWRDAGACIQVNAGSLVGTYGAPAKRVAWLALEEGWAHYLSSDYHSRGECRIEEARMALLARGGETQLHALTVDNPERILVSEPPRQVPRLEKLQATFWQKVFNT